MVAFGLSDDLAEISAICILHDYIEIMISLEQEHKLDNIRMVQA